ncbi:M20/M25/M40 family metallo-hydrolase [Eubacteriales bacterium OttesenSCG-928-M02]|nr:M20/M25/M40 family metallo-hydrolase [Eubacteriales bacterium OttesenSCG-928-M02]
MDYTVSEKSKQAFDAAIALPEVKAGVDFIFEDHENTIKEQLELVVIPAPTFQEERRAQEVCRRFTALGLADVHRDEIGNAIGTYPGAGSGPPIVIEAHMDTVYPMDTVIEPVEKDGFLHCPGIGDNTSGTAALLTIIRAFSKSGITLHGDIYFVGSVREEGMGGFGGIEFFMKAHPDVAAYICIDGVQAGKIVYQATGMTTCSVDFTGIGGHAYGAFGTMANPLHAAARAVAKIADIVVPEFPRTTYCVSNFHAGNDAGVHAIVPTANIKINMRSTQMEPLLQLKKDVYKAIDDGAREESERWGKDTISYEIHEYFNVPAGTQDVNDPICEATYLAMDYLGKTPTFSEGGSTDACFPIGAGIPSVCIGQGEVETHSHSAENERFPLVDTEKGPQSAFLVAVLCSGIPGKLEGIL